MALEFFIDKSPQSLTSDLWSFGVIMFELLTGFLPFPAKEQIDKGINWPKAENPLSVNATDLISKLLKQNARERLYFKQVKAHPFFQKINWASHC